MQARAIILADHSGTAQAETHSQWFLHIWPLWRNILCHLRFVIGEYTMCVFPWHAKQLRKKYQNIVWTWELCLKEHTLFFFSWPGGWGVVAHWTENGFFVIQRSNYWKCDREVKKKKKKVARHKHIKNGAAQTNGVVSKHHLNEGGGGGGITQAQQMKFHKAAGNKYSQPSAIWLLICYLPWQWKCDTISK